METQTGDNDSSPLIHSDNKPSNWNILSKIFLVVIIVLVGVIIALLAVYVPEEDAESSTPEEDVPEEEFPEEEFHPQNICENCKPDNFPAFGYMYAPHTAWTEEVNEATGLVDINYESIPNMAQTAHDMGVNVLYIGGSNGQFYAQTVDERKQLVTKWVEEFRALDPDVFVIWMIASTEIEDAIELADYAGNVLHVNAIASLPPYYDYYNDTKKNYTNEELFDWFGQLVDASGGLPFVYYHLPSTTGFYPDFQQFMREALDGDDPKLPTFSGIKYVQGYSRVWFEMAQEFRDDVALISWSSPQLQFFGAPGRGIGGNDYYMPAFRCMRNAMLKGDVKTALDYQQWQYDMGALLYSNRCIYQKLSDVNMYSNRPPLNPTNQTKCEQSLADLEDAGFFDAIEEQRNNCPMFI
eukprot:276518_1